VQLRRRLSRRALVALAPVSAMIVSGLLASPAMAAPTIPAVPAGGHVMHLSESIHVIRPSGTTAAGVPIFHVTQPGLLSGVHVCQSQGFDEINQQGVVCSDLYAEPVEIGIQNGVAVRAAVEGICGDGDSTSPVVRCANVQISFVLDSAAKLAITSTSGVCGHAAGLCSTGRNIFLAGNSANSGACGSTASEFRTRMIDSQIEMPTSATTLTNPGQLNSQLVSVCT
jgi:hypothetical protein